MTDFASAAMLRLISLGVRRQGLAMQPAPDLTSARIPLSVKQTLASNLLRQYGLFALLRIGEAIKEVEDEPTLLALTLAREPLDLIRRWQRLERFIHSRHRIIIEDSGAELLRLRHVSIESKSPPSAAENALVFGLLIALADRIGTIDLCARPAGSRAWLWRDHQWHVKALPVEVESWEVRWSLAGKSRRQLTPQENDNRIDHRNLPGRDRADWVAQARQRLRADPGRNWQIRDLATDLATSPRTLQRHLAQANQRFAQLLAEARLAHAARLLSTTTMTPAAIGYVSGFSDQAHFTRAFKKSTAITPGAYRAQFGASTLRVCYAATLDSV